jgi:hypothetical protein
MTSVCWSDLGAELEAKPPAGLKLAIRSIKAPRETR